MNTEINSAEDANVYVQGCQNWPDPAKAKVGKGKLGEMLWLVRKRRYLNPRWSQWTAVLTAVFGLAFRRTKTGKSIVWDGAYVAVERNAELSQCHAELAAIWGKQTDLEKERQCLEAQLNQLRFDSHDLESQERKLYWKAVHVLAAACPSYRASVETLMRRVLEQRQVGLYDRVGMRPQPRPGLGSAIREKVLGMRIRPQPDPEEADPELPDEAAE